MEINNHSWIFPPTLKLAKMQFESLYRSLYKTPDRRKPLMIVGARGVGKSAFLDCFESLYTTDNRVNVKRLNIASLPENLIVSELFGHVKGAFTDAKAAKDGHFKTLGDKGLLILEEIGDISPQIQAKLLTVIEDGEYYPVGETRKPEKAKNIQIICTTNKDRTAFREDFFDRFFKFKIPSIHERRDDILYYIGLFYPELILRLQATETLAILSYNWPGNVREIENFCLKIKWRESAITDFNRNDDVKEWANIGDMQNAALENQYFMFSLKNIDDHKKKYRIMYNILFFMTLTDDGSGFQFYPKYGAWQEVIGEKRSNELNRVLRRYHMAIPDFKNAYDGNTFCKLPMKYTLPDDLKEAIINNESIISFKRAYLGFREFCYLTHQMEGDNRNLLFPEEMKSDAGHVRNFSMKEKDLLRDYYGKLLDQTGGNKTAAAKLAGLKMTTFASRLKKYNIS